MEAYAQVLNYAIPFFVFLIGIEYVIGRFMGINTIRSMDVISSLSSGLTNILKDVLGLTIVILSYGFLVKHLSLFEIETTWVLYLITFIGIDFAGYWSHRFQHVINVFWNRHIIHHSSEEFNLACALRQSVSEIFGIFTFLYIPLAILGVSIEVIAVVAPLHLFSQFWYHTRLINKMSILEYIIVTPSHHRVHHAINDEYLDKNFGQIFIIWDRLFGTFQVELAETPAVFGVKKPVQTWNPFLINFMHISQIAKDSFRTEKLVDKVKIWFMPTGWRPADVSEKYPIQIVENPYQLEKYDTNPNMIFAIWHWLQLFITSALVLFLFNKITTFPFNDVLLYAIFIFVSVFSYTTLMDKNKYAILTEAIKIAFGFSLIYLWNGWFGIDEILPNGTHIVVLYFITSFAMSILFSTQETVKTSY
ncbi:MAG: sterol desaturase family protein [Chitinophagales bacterium]